MNKKIIITGGAGFIGTNAASYYLKKGYKVISFDNLSRPGARQNLAWLKKQKGGFAFVKETSETTKRSWKRSKNIGRIKFST